MGLENKHAELVSKLSKDGNAIVAEMTPEKAHIWHMATGVSSESGELLDAIKKYAIYNQPLDMENVMEELGDLEFYMEGLRRAVGLTRSQCLNANYSKLLVRYGKTYSDKAAKERADKAGASAPGDGFDTDGQYR